MFNMAVAFSQCLGAYKAFSVMFFASLGIRDPKGTGHAE